MAKKSKHRKKRGFTVPIAVAAGASVGIANVLNAIKPGVPIGTAISFEASRAYLGFNTISNTWNMGDMWRGTFPLFIGLGVHKVASKLGVNRMLASAGIPIFRV